MRIPSMTGADGCAIIWTDHTSNHTDLRGDATWRDEHEAGFPSELSISRRYCLRPVLYTPPR